MIYTENWGGKSEGGLQMRGQRLFLGAVQRISAVKNSSDAGDISRIFRIGDESRGIGETRFYVRKGVF